MLWFVRPHGVFLDGIFRVTISGDLFESSQIEVHYMCFKRCFLCKLAMPPFFKACKAYVCSGDCSCCSILVYLFALR